jgi:hypothetical protein
MELAPKRPNKISFLELRVLNKSSSREVAHRVSLLSRMSKRPRTDVYQKYGTFPGLQIPRF